MLTSDIALKVDPVYNEIGQRFLADPEAFGDAFARAWFKLTHRDMGPIQRYLGPDVPTEELIWQDRVPAVDHPLVTPDDVADAQAARARLGPDGPPPGRDRVGLGVDLPHQRQAGRRERCPHPAAAAERLGGQRARRAAPRAAGARGRSRPTSTPPGSTKVSLADLIVLAGDAAVEKAAADGGHPVAIPFTPGRTDATAGADRRRVVRAAGADARTGSGTSWARATGCRRSTCSSTGRTCSVSPRRS